MRIEEQTPTPHDHTYDRPPHDFTESKYATAPSSLGLLHTQTRAVGTGEHQSVLEYMITPCKLFGK